MKKENDELTKLFRSRLGEVEMPVREGFWENLENDVRVVASRRRHLFYRISAAASVLLILAGASAALWYLSPKEEIANAFTQVAVSTGTSGKMGVDVIHEEFPVMNASTLSPTPVSSKPVAETEEYSEEESFSMSFSMSFSFSSSSSNSETHDRNNTEYDGQNAYAGGFDDEHTYNTRPVQETEPVQLTGKEKQRKWSVGLFASGGMLNDRIHSQNIQPFILNDLTEDFTSGTIKHKLPFSAGMSVRRELSDRWGIESGVVYTRLNSELTAGENTFYTQDQTLHYIGIPVKADFSLYQNKRLNLYASAGGMVEKCVSGEVKTRYYENGQKTQTAKNSLTPDPLQLSLTAAIGLQCKLSERFSLYAEPGLSYHFDDGSSVSTIRKEKPLNLNLLCGVRMTY